jgi:hypothetical protein
MRPLLFAASLLLANDGFACSCAESTWPPKQALIFRGTVLSAELTKEEAYGLTLVRARVKVVESFRGEPGKFVTLKSGRGGMSGSCGIPFAPGEDYLIFTNKDGMVYGCTGSGFYYGSSKDLLRRLRELKPR